MVKALRTIKPLAPYLLGLLWLIVYVTAHLWPASYWLEVRSVRVTDATPSTQLLLYVDRTIHRPFQGSWNVTIKRIDARQEMVACAENAMVFYEPKHKMPPVVTLGWWTNGTCSSLPPGFYVVDTIWEIRGNMLLPSKTVHNTSNVFEIRDESQVGEHLLQGEPARYSPKKT